VVYDETFVLTLARPRSHRRFLSTALATLVPLAMLATGCGDGDPPACDPSQSACTSGPTFPGLTGEVRILRDDLGVVHVYGGADADVFYGAGYAQAVDRLFQMDLTRRRALGRRAEVLGASAVSEDELLRRVGIGRWGQANADLLLADHPDEHALLVAWVAGVNARIAEVKTGAAPLPYGFGPDELDYLPEEWTEGDALAIGKLILFGNANQIEYEILATILRDYFTEIYETVPLYAPLYESFVVPPDERPETGAQPLGGSWPYSSERGQPDDRFGRALPPDAAAKLAAFAEKMAPIRPGASNNWAIAGDLTDTGTPLIAGDPHQGLMSPSLMWAHHMNSADGGGTIDVAGFAFVGVPGVQLGHNRDLAWTATTNYPDVMDLWSVAVSDGVAALGGQSVPVQTTEEQILVRDEDPRTITVEEIPGFGVLLPDDLAPVPVTPLGFRLLVGWPGFRPTQEAHAFFGMAGASTLDDFDAAVDQMEIGNFNFVAASAEGITYRSSPLVPKRAGVGPDYEPYAVLDGSDPNKLWTGEYLPLEQMPNSRDPERGWLTSANNDPFGFTSDSSLVGDAFYFGIFFDPGTRAARIESEIERLIAEDGAISVEDAQALQTDAYTMFADTFVPALEAALANVATDPALAEFEGREDLVTLTAALAAWDRHMVRSSSAAVAYQAFAYFATRRAIGDDLSIAFDAIIQANAIYVLKIAAQTLNGAFAGADDLLQEGRDHILLSALADTSDFLTARFGSIEPSAYTWADFHGTRFGSIWGEELDGGFVPTDGGDGTVNVSGAKFFEEEAEPVERLESGGGAIYRMVASIGEDGVPRAVINYPRGNSGDPTSPHWDDTLGDWVEGNYRPLAFEAADLTTATEEIVLGP
jgi:penicillin G amidase